MSRLARPGAAPSSTKPVITAKPDDDLQSATDEICPVCKSSRYLNPNMRFLVNPTCYHKMCSSCVDRIFSHGPAQCPVAKCHKTLRKNHFRKQTFDDMKIEREVDIRRRVSQVFNRREDEFESLKAWNDYLEEVEDLTYALIEGIDVDANKKKLERYEAEHTASIKANANFAKDLAASRHAQEATEKEQLRLRRAAARRQDEEERRELEEGRRRVIDDLATGTGDPEAIARAGENRLKTSMLRRTEAEQRQRQTRDQQQQASVPPVGSLANSGSMVIRGLKKRTAPEKELPYDPFDGILFDPQYHVLQEYYDWDWLEEARTRAVIVAGGYDVPAYCQRALCEAFSGLGVFVGDEMAAKDYSATMSAPALAEPPAKQPTKHKKAKLADDDVF